MVTPVNTSDMRSPATPRRGFTLIELMIAVCIIGVLASVALPTYQRFIMQSRSMEGVENIGMLYRGAQSYWELQYSGQGIANTSAGGVLVGPGGVGHCVMRESPGLFWNMLPPFPPTAEKRSYNYASNKEFSGLGFSKSAPGYFSSSWLARGDSIPDPGGMGGFGQCGATSGPAYYFNTVADLDGDGLVGGFSLYVYIQDGSLVRQAGMGSLLTMLEASGMGGVCPMCLGTVD